MPPLVTLVRWSNKLPELYETLLRGKFLLTDTEFQPFCSFNMRLYSIAVFSPPRMVTVLSPNKARPLKQDLTRLPNVSDHLFV